MRMFTDATWAVWEPLIDEVRPRGKTPPQDLRQMMSGTFEAFSSTGGAAHRNVFGWAARRCILR